MNFKEVEHTADRALWIFGTNLTDLLVNAAEGMTHMMVSDVSVISTEIEKSIDIEAIDAETHAAVSVGSPSTRAGISSWASPACRAGGGTGRPSSAS